MTVFAVISLLSAALGFEATVFVNRMSLQTGQTLKVELSHGGGSAPELTWGASTYHFVNTPAVKWRALIPVGVTRSAGRQELRIRSQSGEKFERPLEITVLKSDFGTESITFSSAKKKLLNDPAEEEESADIRRALAGARQDPDQRWDGLWDAPIPGQVISPFGILRDKVGQKNKNDFHKGVDLAGPAGEPIRAPAGAAVILAEKYKFHGHTVVLNHGHGVGSIYIHMESIEVAVGDVVRQGEKIGAVGSTGLATAPHLHWGVYVQGEPVDPMQWLEETF